LITDNLVDLRRSLVRNQSSTLPRPNALRACGKPTVGFPTFIRRLRGLGMYAAFGTGDLTQIV
jgi:hypothetical protein